MKKVLLVEDDPITQKILTHSLGNEFEFTVTASLLEAKKIILQPNDISIVVLDRVLPDGDGINLCQHIKDTESLKHIPVIFLTSSSAENDKILCFFSGADDYVCKPFSVLELKARMLARLKHLTRKIYTTNIEVDLDTYSVFLKENQTKSEINLTRTEFKLFVFLIQNAGRIFSREFLLEKIWGQTLHVNDRVVDTQMSHLRRKLFKSTLHFESLRGEGYKVIDQGLSTLTKLRTQTSG